ncbi:hypothetical protein DICSQDRAFT_142985 [Dichomitus squalens LYAD-421 SS1]|uniref:uncharacterized protein n=1 Tax=Dichomitus squalens (strain LYAD-421) TaxID=732165 RepID=UPI0004415B51|nr:uncharacterized protein DICSQDRAFT_142985 [Dichomitus squalens LYAD-421 SS1]EJF67468.1 hypothetical protein DICSQDRAFT_142985 [Dichomitus squalens LYAD-421 SS1]
MSHAANVYLTRFSSSRSSPSRMTTSMGPPTCGPTMYNEGDPSTEGASARVQRSRTLSDVSGAIKHDQRRIELDREMRWREVPLEHWFRTYMSGADPTGISFQPFAVDLESREQGMYHGLRTGLNDCLRVVGWAGYETLTTDRLPDISMSSSSDNLSTALRPDMGIYPMEHICATSQEHSSLDTRVAWAWAEVLIEVKFDPKAAPFSSRHTPRSAFLPTGRERCLNRGQLVEYATEIFNRQHRQSLFMIHFTYDCARFLRFDRSGAVVSEEFDYIACPQLIGSFLSRLSRMGRAERGYDPTATLASEEQATTFRELHNRFHPDSATARGLGNAVADGWPIYLLTIDAPFSSDGAAVRRGTSPSSRHFLVGKPASQSSSLVGKVAKGFVAYDMTNQQVVFIKDGWRPDSSEVQSEYETYLQLREMASGELYIPTLLGGGDVTFDGQRQQTTSFNELSNLIPPLAHCRLIFKEICRPLEDFTNSYELVKAVTWALVAHSKAWRQCGILHRDISIESILIYDSDDLGLPTPNGTIDQLSNWDIAMSWKQIDPGGAPTYRSTSWPCMSARLQEHPEKQHELADDLESFMHVLNYCALRHLPTGMSSAEVAHLVQSLYDTVIQSDAGPPKGSPLKLEKVQNGTPFVKGLPGDHPMAQLLAELSELCKAHYEHVVLPGPETYRTSCSDIFAGGLYCGAQSTLPDYDGVPVHEDALDGCKVDLPHSFPSPNPVLSPLRDHDRMVGVCMRAIRKVWPRVDKRQDAVRVRPSTRGGSRLGAKRTWSESDFQSASREVTASFKRARRDSLSIRPRCPQRRRSGGPHV